jgi:hypothetical protein
MAHHLIHEFVPDFALVHPDTAELIVHLADATFPLPKLVVWLDELQYYLQGPHQRGTTYLTATTIRKLLDAPTPVIVIATMWPEIIRSLTDSATDSHGATGRLAKPVYPEARAALTLPGLHQVILSSFNNHERQRATQLASTDPRLATALADTHFGPTEVLAGGPALIARWQSAPHTTRAITTAAIDARRLGIHTALTATLLASAARAYLPQPTPDDHWFADALTDATTIRPDEGATAALLPAPDPDNRFAIGYTVADYLLQYGRRSRAAIVPPDLFWRVIADQVTDIDDLASLTVSAYTRGLLDHAERFARQAAAAGHSGALGWLTQILVDQDRHTECEQILRDAAAAGNPRLDASTRGF